MAFDRNDAKNSEIVNYFKGKVALIYETSSSGRSTLKKVLSNLGMDTINIHMVQDMEDAQIIMKSKKPHIVISAYNLGKYTGLDLLDIHLENSPNRLDVIFCLLSEKTSLAAATIALEREIDIYIARPFNLQVLEDEFLKVLEEKVSPSAQVKNLEEAKEYYFAKDYEKAIAQLERSVSHDAPTLVAKAQFYKGNSFKELGDLEKALESYIEALELDSKHYGSLQGARDITFEKKDYQEAYKFQARLLKEYPLNPFHIPLITKLSILTEQYDDIYKIWKLFDQLEEADPIIKLNVSAGMTILAEHLMRSDKNDSAIEILESAVKFSMGKKEILRRIITNLIKLGATEKADQIFGSFADENKNTKEFKLMELEINNKAHSAEKTLMYAMNLTREGINDEIVYQIMLEKSVQLDRKAEEIDDIVHKATQLYPNSKERFVRIAKR